MKKVMLLVGMLVVSGQVVSAAPFVELDGGVYAANGAQAPAYGFGIGSEIGSWRNSVSYWSAQDIALDSEKFASDNANLHTIGVNVLRVFQFSEVVNGTFGGGVGYTIPNLFGATERADNGLSFNLKAGLERDINDAVSIGINVMAFRFETDTHTTTYGSHMEKLSNGQAVEVLDVTHRDNSVEMNALVLALKVNW